MRGMTDIPTRYRLHGIVSGTILALLLGVAGMQMLTPRPAMAGWTEVKASRNGHFVVKARINGSTTRAIIDTGATVVAIPYGKARRMGLKPAFLKFNIPVWTANGKVMAARTTLRRVEINGVSVHDVEAMVLPKGALQDVLIGMSYLGKLRRYAVNDGKLRLVN